MESKGTRMAVKAAETSSGCVSSNVGDDVWLEILKRLPLKDILRCRCVQRSWCSLVASPYFIKDHLHSKLRKLEDNGDVLLFRECTGLLKPQEQAKLSFLDSKTLSSMSGYFYYPIAPVNSSFFRVVGSVHGIICLLDDDCYNPAKDVTLLWNPSVYRYIRLPQPPSNLNHNHHHKQHYHFSFPRFTFDPVKKDYVVVRIMYCHVELAKEIVEPPVIEFYSYGDCEWKTVSNMSLLEPPYFIVEETCSQYRSSADGAVCWIAWNRGSSVLLLFSAVEYELKMLAFPEELGSRLNPMHSSVVEFRGLLSVMEVTSPFGVEWSFNIWSWINSEDQWCQMLRINTAVDGLRIWERRAFLSIHKVTDDECVIGSRTVGRGSNLEIVSFHLQTHQIDRLREHVSDPRVDYMGSYLQSLLLLDEESGALSYDPSTIPRSYQGQECMSLRIQYLSSTYDWRRGVYDKYRYNHVDRKRRRRR